MADMTIDELAREAGLSVRNVRSHTTRGLLPPPEVRGRTGYYGPAHLERLRLIQELQNDGMSLGLVERLLKNRPDVATRLLDLRHTVMPQHAGGEEAVTVTVEALVERFGPFDEEMLRRALALGALVPRTDGTFTVPRPGLLDTAEAATRTGVSLTAALGIALEVQRHCQDLSRSFVEMVMGEIWDPFTEAGRPDDQWPQVASAVDAVRPLANRIFSQLLEPAIDAEIERAFGEELREQAQAE